MTTATHDRASSLESMLEHGDHSRRQKLDEFAILNLGIMHSLWSGVLTVDAAVERFYNARNCLYVRRRSKNSTCDEIMSRGVQLSDLLEILPVPTAQREFARELDAIRTLCLKLLGQEVSRYKANHSNPATTAPRG